MDPCYLMIKLFILIFYFLFLKIGFASEGECYFEEVYKNGETQNVIFLVADENIRYEYFDSNLFTIIYTQEKFYLTNNNNKQKSDEIKDQRVSVFKSLANIIKEYPNIDEQILFDGHQIDIDKSSNNNFPKRVSIQSNRANLSIYLFDCISKPINKLFFKINPMFEYPR